MARFEEVHADKIDARVAALLHASSDDLARTAIELVAVTEIDVQVTGERERATRDFANAAALANLAIFKKLNEMQGAQRQPVIEEEGEE